jgi:hypothetical protein
VRRRLPAALSDTQTVRVVPAASVVVVDPIITLSRL